ncbi:hypothetical protein BH10BAC1_BH10BAC1_21670 [soil metagenome]
MNYITPPGQQVNVKDATPDKLSFSDVLFRKPRPDYRVNWQAETSLVKLDNSGNVEQRIITLTWGFRIPQGTTGWSAYPTALKVKAIPSQYHLDMLNKKPTESGFRQLVK